VDNFTLTYDSLFNIIRRGMKTKILILLSYIGLKKIKEVDINENDIPTKKEI